MKNLHSIVQRRGKEVVQRTVDSSPSESIISPKIKCSKTRKEIQSVVSPMMARGSDHKNPTDGKMYDDDVEKDSESTSEIGKQ